MWSQDWQRGRGSQKLKAGCCGSKARSLVRKSTTKMGKRFFTLYLVCPNSIYIGLEALVLQTSTIQSPLVKSEFASSIPVSARELPIFCWTVVLASRKRKASFTSGFFSGRWKSPDVAEVLGGGGTWEDTRMIKPHVNPIMWVVPMIFLDSPYGSFHFNRGTPSHHPAIERWNVPWNRPSIARLGYPHDELDTPISYG